MAAPFERTSTPGVFRRGSRYVVTYTDPSGRRRKRSAATLAEARLMKSALAADVARGEYRESSRVRFEDYARDWVRTYEGRTSRGIRRETIAEYERDLQLHVVPVLGRTTPSRSRRWPLSTMIGSSPLRAMSSSARGAASMIRGASSKWKRRTRTVVASGSCSQAAARSMAVCRADMCASVGHSCWQSRHPSWKQS